MIEALKPLADALTVARTQLLDALREAYKQPAEKSQIDEITAAWEQIKREEQRAGRIR